MISRPGEQAAVRILGVLALLIVCGLALVACGTSGQASGRLLVPAPAPAAIKEPSGAEVEASIRTAIAHCKRAVANAQTLSTAAREELEVVCNKVVDLTGKEAEELRHVVCNEVANDPASAAAAREKAFEVCEREAR